MDFKILFISICSLILIACSDSTEQLNEQYGKGQPRDRQLPSSVPLAIQFNDHVMPILANRCVVCHGCYDAPCQLKLSGPEGIDRGASPLKVYDANRLLAMKPSRLFVDAQSIEEWRDKGFSSMLNERDQTTIANLDGSVLYQLLVQKNQHPQPQAGRLPANFNFKIKREDFCPDENTLEDYQEEFPLAGMPYGLPNLSNDEFRTLERWIAQGAPMSEPIPLQKPILNLIVKWEKKLNGITNKEQLINRYIYEHLFLADLYFEQVSVEEEGQPIFFRLVRSSTPPGQAIKEIATRRPYEDPKVYRVYYRLQRNLE
ncbi:MAG: fatty acid cis/trans isomerase, partial [Psychromonas sp.]